MTSAPRTPARPACPSLHEAGRGGAAEAEPLVDAGDVVVGRRQEDGLDAPAPRASSTSAAVTAAPRPWRRRAGSVATPMISATSSSGRSVPTAIGPVSSSTTAVTLCPPPGARARGPASRPRPAPRRARPRPGGPAGPGRGEADLLDGERGAEHGIVGAEEPHGQRRAPRGGASSTSSGTSITGSAIAATATARSRAPTRSAPARAARAGARGRPPRRRSVNIVLGGQPRPRVVRPGRGRDEERERADLLDPGRARGPASRKASMALSRRCTRSRSAGSRGARSARATLRCPRTGTRSRRRGRARPRPARQ